MSVKSYQVSEWTCDFCGIVEKRESGPLTTSENVFLYQVSFPPLPKGWHSLEQPTSGISHWCGECDPRKKP